MADFEKAVETLDAIEKSLTDIKEDVTSGKASLSCAQKQIDELGKQQLLMSKQLLEIQQKSQVVSAPQAPRTLGGAFVKSDSYRQFLQNHRAASIVVDKTGDEGAGSGVTADDLWYPVSYEFSPHSAAGLMPAMRIPGILGLEQRELRIEGLLPHIPVSGSSVEYLKETTFTNGAAPVAEAAAKPSTTMAFTTTQVPVQVVAHWTKITRQLADDAPALQAFINARMVYGVNLAVENQLITGDGSAPNLSGLMKTGNYTAQSFTLAQIGGSGSNLLDLLRISIATINAENYKANAILLNPMDWAVLQGLKNSDGNYYFGNPNVSFDGTSVWGVRVVPTAAITKGTYLVGDFTQAATIYDRMQTELVIASQNEDDFLKNLYTIRAERRLALAVERPKALVGGTYAVPLT